MQRLTAAIEQIVNRSNYTLKIINDDTIKIKTNWNIANDDILKRKIMNSTHTNLGNNMRTEW
jgi:hypothetical protein